VRPPASCWTRAACRTWAPACRAAHLHCLERSSLLLGALEHAWQRECGTIALAGRVIEAGRVLGWNQCGIELDADAVALEVIEIDVCVTTLDGVELTHHQVRNAAARGCIGGRTLQLAAQAGHAPFRLPDLSQHVVRGVFCKRASRWWRRSPGSAQSILECLEQTGLG
jgi:hypothetical protein